MHCGLSGGGRHRRSTIIAVWVVCTIALFIIATAVSRSYDAKRHALAQRWFERGLSALNVAQPDTAIVDFRNALAYSPRNRQYRLQLAEALLAAGHPQEALDYLDSLWQEDPSDGRVNLALARLHAERRDIPQAMRYYHGAMYGEWQEDPIKQRRAVQLEMVRFLLQNGANDLAKSELLSAAQEAPGDTDLHLKIAELLDQAGDFADALQENRNVIRLEPGNATALRGAGIDAFQLGQYRTAEEYLRRALERDRNDQQTEVLLEKLRTIASANPYQRGLTTAERQRRVIAAFSVAGARLEACAQQKGEALNVEHPSSDLQKLYAEWDDLSPGMNPRLLRQQPDQADSAMDLVFRIEEKTRALCGPPAGVDEALLLIGENLQGSGQ